MKIKKSGIIFFLGILLHVLTLPGLPAAHASAESDGTAANIRTVTRNEGLFDIEYPIVYGLANMNAQEKINAFIDDFIQDFYEKRQESGNKGILRYQVYKNADNVLSLTLLEKSIGPGKDGDSKTWGLNFDTETGNAIELERYYNETALLNRVQDGLSYVYNIETAKEPPLPDTYYLDKDDNVIVIYHAGSVAAGGKEEIEVNVTAADDKKPAAVKASTEQVQGLNDAVIAGIDVRLRSEPGFKGKVLGYLLPDEEVFVGQKKQVDGRDWLHVVRKKGGTGWVAAEFCRLSLEQPENEKTAVKGVISGEEVRLRSEPSTNADILDWLDRDEVVKINETVSAGGRDWCRITRLDGKEGWVAAEYCLSI